MILAGWVALGVGLYAAFLIFALALCRAAAKPTPRPRGEDRDA